MTLNHSKARPAVAEAENDRSIPIVVFLLLALVFVPVIGVPIAFIAFGTPSASVQMNPDQTLHAAHPKPLRG
jgi:hypothetical protein